MLPRKNILLRYMTGGLMQLVAYGAQDIYLTGNPMITYFKVVYRRHTNFAMESIQQTLSGNPGWGQRVTALISRNGDLVSGMTLEVTLPARAGNDRWTANVGHFIMSQVEVEIGGQLIDRHYSDWLEIWAQLTVPASKQVGYKQMIGESPKDSLGQSTGLQEVNEASAVTVSVRTVASRKLYIPLQFWFCRNVGLALPLIALQYHEVKVNITFNNYANVAMSAVGGAAADAAGTISADLWVDYIYLDTDERRRFAQVSHEYLIEQLQFNGDTDFAAVGADQTEARTSIQLNFNHPVKEIVWVGRLATATRQPANYTTALAVPALRGIPEVTNAGNTVPAKQLAGDIMRENIVNPYYAAAGNAPAAYARNITCVANLKLNGQDRFAQRPGTYFNRAQTYAAHTCVPESPGINVYSFALKPEEHQPSGTCNFSRIDNASLVLGLNATGGVAGSIKVFATNYNVLRVMSGMGGLAYSN
jgi:hypothetical protein